MSTLVGKYLPSYSPLQPNDIDRRDMEPPTRIVRLSMDSILGEWVPIVVTVHLMTLRGTPTFIVDTEPYLHSYKTLL